jgi:hypothetical protein
MSEEIRRVSKVNKWLVIPGIILLIIGLTSGAVCLLETITTIVGGDDFEIALLILVLIVYGGISIVSSSISLLVNTIAHKKAKNKFTFILVVLSLIGILLTLASFILWIIGAKI